MSKSLTFLLDNLSTEGPIQLTNEEITEPIFLKAMKWCQIQGSKEALNNSVHWCELNKWEKEFTNIPNSELLPLLITAYYLKIQGLIRLLVKVVAKKNSK